MSVPPTTQPAPSAPEPRTTSGAPALSQRTRLALALLGNALSFGALADALLRSNGLGVNVAAGVLVLALVLVMLARAHNPESRLRDHALAIPVLVFGLAFAWRDADGLGAINLLMLVGSMIVWSAAVRGAGAWDVRLAQVGDYLLAFRANVVSVLSGLAPVVFGDLAYAELSRAVGGRRALSVTRGLLLAAPLLLIFGSLLASADPVFGRLLSGLVSFELDELVGHLVVTGIFAWLAGGYLRGALSRQSAMPTPAVAAPATPSAWSLGVVEVGCVLGSLNVLFLTFVLVQLRYFFGGAATVQATAGLTYADYARRGFFELVFVAALALPLLIAAGALLRREQARDDRIFRWLAGGMLALLHVVMLSAARRMWLYTAEFGLTEDRLYASAFMGWLLVVFTWFELTVLRGRPGRFAFGALLSAWVAAAALNVANPHALIVRTNVDRLLAGKRFDPEYVGRLGADALPPLLEAAGRATGAERCQLIDALWTHHVDQRESQRPLDWRASNLGWYAADRALARHGRARSLMFGPATAANGCVHPRERARAARRHSDTMSVDAAAAVPAPPASSLDLATPESDSAAVRRIAAHVEALLSPRLGTPEGAAELAALFAPTGRLVLTGSRRLEVDQQTLEIGRDPTALTPALARWGVLTAPRLRAETTVQRSSTTAHVAMTLFANDADRRPAVAYLQLVRLGGEWRIVSMVWDAGRDGTR